MKAFVSSLKVFLFNVDERLQDKIQLLQASLWLWLLSPESPDSRPVKNAMIYRASLC